MKRFSSSIVACILAGLASIFSPILVHATSPPEANALPVVQAQSDVLDFNLFLEGQTTKSAVANANVVGQNREGYFPNPATPPPAIDPTQNAPPMQVGGGFDTVPVVSFDNSCAGMDLLLTASAVTSPVESKTQGQEVPADTYGISAGAVQQIAAKAG